MTSEVSFVDHDGRQSVLKRCRDARYIEWLCREHHVLAALSGCSLSIPRVIRYHEVQNAGRIVDAWLLMSRLSGESLWDVVLRCAPTERCRYFRRVGKLLRELHTTPAPAELQSERPWMYRMLEQARNNLSWCDGSSALLARLETTRPPPLPEVLIHGDLALDNVLVGDDGTMRLIDWSGGGIGDPRYDIALALGTEPELSLGEAELAAFFDGYGSARRDTATMRWFQELYEFF
jgi:aminoglycoside phosphotransferase (APT) family kinase protein